MRKRNKQRKLAIADHHAVDEKGGRSRELPATVGTRNGDSKSTPLGSAASLGNSSVSHIFSVFSASVQNLVCALHKFLTKEI